MQNNRVKHIFFSDRQKLPPVSFISLDIYHPRTGNTQTHQHSGCQILAAVRGDLAITVDRRTFLCRPGYILVIPAEISHSWSTESGAETCQMLLEETLGPEFGELHAMVRNIREPVLMDVDTETVEALHESLKTAAEKPFPGDGLMITGGSLLLLGKLVRVWCRQKEARSLDPIHPGLCAAIQYARNCSYRKCALKELAHAGKLSVSRFSELFRQEFKMSPMNFLREKRMEMARLRILSENVEVKELVRDFGFESENHFTRSFKKYYGLPPRRYQKKYGHFPKS